MRAIILATLIPATAMLTGCPLSDSGGGAIPCTDEAVPAVSVHVSDAITGAPLTDRLSGFVRDGAFVDSLQGFNEWLRAADERPGTYEVIVSRPGYLDWDTTGVHTTRDECHVITAILFASLQPEVTE